MGYLYTSFWFPTHKPDCDGFIVYIRMLWMRAIFRIHIQFSLCFQLNANSSSFDSIAFNEFPQKTQLEHLFGGPNNLLISQLHAAYHNRMSVCVRVWPEADELMMMMIRARTISPPHSDLSCVRPVFCEKLHAQFAISMPQPTANQHPSRPHG